MGFLPDRVTVSTTPVELLVAEKDRSWAPGATVLVKVVSGSVLLGVDSVTQGKWLPLDTGEIYTADYQLYDSLKAVSSGGTAAVVAVMRSGI